MVLRLLTVRAVQQVRTGPRFEQRGAQAWAACTPAVLPCPNRGGPECLPAVPCVQVLVQLQEFNHAQAQWLNHFAAEHRAQDGNEVKRRLRTALALRRLAP